MLTLHSWWSMFTGLTAIAGDWWVAGLLGTLGFFFMHSAFSSHREGAAYPNSAAYDTSWMAPMSGRYGDGLVLSAVGVGYDWRRQSSPGLWCTMLATAF